MTTPKDSYDGHADCGRVCQAMANSKRGNVPLVYANEAPKPTPGAKSLKGVGNQTMTE
jgi:hypothetical protein